jgi:hypothetical protein
MFSSISLILKSRMKIYGENAVINVSGTNSLFKVNQGDDLVGLEIRDLTINSLLRTNQDYVINTYREKAQHDWQQ